MFYRTYVRPAISAGVCLRSQFSLLLRINGLPAHVSLL